VSELTVAYRGAGVGADHVGLALAAGEIGCIVGPNGAGKTSTLRAIAGFPPGESGYVANGKIAFLGEDITAASVRRRLKLGLSYIPERQKVFAELTVTEHLRLAARIDGGGRGLTEAELMALFPPLTKRRESKAGFMSGGERQMLAMACALRSRPRLILIDELSQGLSPAAVVSFKKTLRDIAATGVAVLLTEQNARLALEVSSHLHVMDAGTMVAHGTPSEISAQEDVASLFLGRHTEQLGGAR
jgi:branched-chain amino acid transport system ATP-binding protein